MTDDKDTPEYRQGTHEALVIAIGLAIAWGSEKEQDVNEPHSPADRLEKIRASARLALLRELPESRTPRQTALMTAGFDSTFVAIAEVVRGITAPSDD